MMYKLFLRPFLFKLNPEKAHYLTFNLLKFGVGHAFGRLIAKLCFNYEHPKLKKELFGLNFENKCHQFPTIQSTNH